MNYFLKISGHEAVEIRKDYFTVGAGLGYDLRVDGTDGGIAFTLLRTDDTLTLTPGAGKIRINGASVAKPVTLNVCDRIECLGQAIVVLDAPPSVSAVTSTPGSPLKILAHLAGTLASEESASQALKVLLDFAGAESGTLIAEKETADWEILAEARGENSSTESDRNTLVSHTVLAEAIRTRKPVYVESIIGNPWAAQASVLEAQVFSFACLPLGLEGQRIRGALFLYTRTPGRSLRKETLDGVAVLGAHLALMLSCQRQLSSAKKDNERLKQSAPLAADGIVFKATTPEAPMARLMDRVTRVGAHNLSVLVRGETGTGKERISREIHRRSPRAAGPFVAVNCAAIPPTLMESILFGHAKGAFTGASKDTPGKFQQASGGTIFLDEIGDLSLELQTKLLRVLQEKEIEPVGGSRTISVDIRIVSATHQDLETMVKEGRFRSDLFFRLNGATLNVPALRERGSEEISLLAQYFLAKQSADLQLSPEAEALLLRYHWPGNVRELEQAISRAAALCNDGVIEPGDLELEAAVSHAGSATEPRTLKAVQERFTKDYIQKILDSCSGSRVLAATKLGVSERTLYRMLATDKDGGTSDKGAGSPN